MSAPAEKLQKHKLLRGAILDFGCGRGTDAEFLGAARFDPNFFPLMPPGQYDTVLMTYVLNTLPKVLRLEAIQTALDKVRFGGVLWAAWRDDIQGSPKYHYGSSIGRIRSVEQTQLGTLQYRYQDEADPTDGLLVQVPQMSEVGRWIMLRSPT